MLCIRVDLVECIYNFIWWVVDFFNVSREFFGSGSDFFRWFNDIGGCV